MISPVFTAHLMTTGGGLSGKPLCEETTDDNLLDITEALQLFAHFLELDQLDEEEDTSIDLSASYDNFIELYSIDEESAEYIAAVILETSQEIFGDSEDDTAIHFLRQLAKPLETERGEINKDGMTVPNTQIGSKAVLAMHPVSKIKDAFNNTSFSADKYTYFPRGENRYGHEAEFKDPNQAYNKIGGFPLMNPILNVNTAGGSANMAKKLPSGRAYESIDSVGLSNPMHFRVMSKLTGEYVTKFGVPKEEVDQIADELNQLFQEQLAANPELIKEFERATSLPSEVPVTHLQEGLNDHSRISKYANYLQSERFNGIGRKHTNGYGKDAAVPDHAQAFHETQSLLNERRKTFGENEDQDVRANVKAPGRKR